MDREGDLGVSRALILLSPEPRGAGEFSELKGLSMYARSISMGSLLVSLVYLGAL